VAATLALQRVLIGNICPGPSSSDVPESHTTMERVYVPRQAPILNGKKEHIHRTIAI
jgi:hypothetical protein